MRKQGTLLVMKITDEMCDAAGAVLYGQNYSPKYDRESVRDALIAAWTARHA